MSEPKRGNSNSNSSKQQKPSHQSNPTGPHNQPIDIDSLAREKVDEVERLLDSSSSHKSDNLNNWFTILKKIITAADLHRTNDKNDKKDETKSKPEAEDSIYADFADDNEQFNAIDPIEQFESNSVKWTIRVRAFKILHRIVLLFPNSITFKLLPDLVRLAFVAATSPYDDLKMQGFEMFKFVIHRFASTEEKELPGHSILEQYKSQVLSALKPAFNLDAPPYITAIASQVCSLWICYGLETDSLGLKRAYQFMIQATEKLERQSVNHHSKLYTESELEQERLSILDAWAQLYITCKEPDTNNSKVCPKNQGRNELADLVEPSVDSIVDRWWEALKDYALLTMPAPKFIGISHDNENIYTREVALRLFEPIWSNLIFATTLWLCPNDSSHRKQDNGTEKHFCDTRDKKNNRSTKDKYFKFTSGLLMREMCKCQRDSDIKVDSFKNSTIISLKSLNKLVNDKSMRLIIRDNIVVAEEFYCVTLNLYSRCIKMKDPFGKSMRPLLDSLLEIVMSEIMPETDLAVNGVEYLIDSIRSDLHSLDRIDVMSEQLTRTIMKANNLIALIKIQPKIFEGRRKLLDANIDLFGAMIEFDKEPLLGINLLNSLMNSCSAISSLEISYIAQKLFTSEISVIMKIANLIQDEKQEDKDSVSRLVSQLETYLRLTRLMIGKIETDQRLSFTKSYLETMVNCIPKTNKLIQTPRVKDQTNLFLKHIEELKNSFPSEFDASVTDDIGKVLASIQKPPRDNKIVAEEGKRNTSSPKKLPAGSTKAKITLKADFSNFYAKKT